MFGAPPETEVKLQELQEQFLNPNCSKRIKDEFFLLLRTYARSITLKEIKRKGLSFSSDKIDEISTDATLLLLNQYKKEGWVVKASFAGALRWKVIETLYKPANEEMNYSLNRTLGEDESSKEMLDLVSSTNTPFAGASIGYQEDPGEVVIKNLNVAKEEINNLIDQAYDILPYSTFMKFLAWLVLFLRKPKTRNYLENFSNNYLNSKEESAYELLLMEMRNRLYLISQ